MYALAERARPRRATCALARATFAEMALAGITRVGEFHYLHHGPGGTPYARPERDGRRAIVAAAAEAGVRITLLDACYLHGGIGASPTRSQRRFCDGDADAWARARRRAAPRRRRARVGAAIHSVRAVDPRRAGDGRGVGARRAAGRCTRTCPSSRPRTRPASPPTAARRPRCSPTPARSARASPRCTPRTSTDADVALLGDARRRVLPVPDDRARPRRRHRPGARALRDAGARAGARQRLARGDRPVRGGPGGRARRAARDAASAARHRAADAAAARRPRGGYASLGWPDGGRIEPGALADLVTVGLDGVRLAGTRAEHALDAARVRGAARRRRATSWSAGAEVVRDGRHVTHRRRRPSCARRSRRWRR